MNHSVSTTRHRSEPLEQRLGRRVRVHLNASEATLGHDIEQRLRFARERALGAARATAARRAQGLLVAAGSVALGSTPWRWRIASLMPLLVLVAGLVLIGQVHRTQEIHAAAQVDAVLLADELPPAAYSDPGFAEFLKRTLP